MFINDYYLLYFTVNILFVILLAFSVRIVWKAFGEKTDVRLYRAVALSLIVVMTSDAVWALLEAQNFFLADELNMLVNIIYMMASGVVGYTWLIYIQSKIHNWEPATGRQLALSGIPLLILIAVCLSNSATGWLFTISSSNSYHRGKFFAIYFIVFIGYFAATMISVIVKRLGEKRRVQREEYTFIIYVTVLPLIGAVIRYYVFVMPTVFTMTAIALMLIMINRLSLQVSNDSLTGMNNRKSYDEYVEAHLANMGRNYKLYLAIMDINYFKMINDRFGHVEGDRALKRLSEVIKRSCGGKSVFCARLGGDEFVLVSKDTNDREIRAVMCGIDERLKEINESREYPYSITVSMGLGEVTGEGAGAAEKLMELADEQMYINKAEFKKSLKGENTR